MAARPIRHSAWISNCNQRATIKGNNPLSKSPASVNAAAFLLPVRNMLVAPGFPEPRVRGSGKFKNLAIIIEDEIDPTKYAMTTAIINSI